MPCTATGRNFAQGRPIAPFALCSRHCWHFCSQCSSQFRAQRSSPPEKLDIKLVIEADDLATWQALADLKLTAPFEIILAPQEGPRTKPKALNAALLFARGTFTVVYDAEDRPEPDQLRRAVDMFVSNDDRLACVQGALTIDNTDDSWLAGLFTAE